MASVYGMFSSNCPQQQWHTKDLAKGGGGIPKTKGVEREEGTPQNSQFVCYAYDVPYNRAE